MTVSAQDAHEYPIYNARFRLIVPLLDADGDPISPSSPDTELSQDMGTFADATNEATEVATSSGIIYVDLIATEMDTKSTIVQVKSTGAKTTVAVLNPRRLPVIRTGTAQAGGNSTITLDASASAIDDYYVGMFVNITNDTPSNVLGQARVIIDYVGSTKVATIQGTWGTNPSSSSTFEVLLPAGQAQFAQVDINAILGTAVSTPATAGILDVNVKNIDNDAASASGTVTFPNATVASTTNITAGTVTTATNVTTVNGLAAAVITAASIAADAITAAKVADGTIDAATFAAGAINAAAIATDAITAAKIAADAIGASELAADAVTEIQSGLATAAALTTVDDFLDTEIAAIKAVTDALPNAGALTTIQADLDDIQTRIPAALTANGNIKADTLRVSGTVQTAGDIPALINTVDDFLDTEIAAIKAVTDALPNAGALTTIQADLDDLQTRVPAALVGGRMDANVGAISTDATAADNAEAFFDGTGYAGTNNVIPTVTTVTTLTGHTPQTGDSFAIVNSGTHGNAAIKGYVDDIGAAGAGLSAVPWNAAWDAEVQSEVQDALDATVADSVPADGSRPSISQALLMITRFLMEKSVSSTTVTVKKEDGSTSSMTFTLDSATDPTSITRTS